jgi:hypothetical protein
MGLLDFLKRGRREREEPKAKLGQFMSQAEVEEWWELLKDSPRGFLVAPKVPLVLLLEEVGGMNEELLSEVVPYVLVAPSGQPFAAYLREEQKALWLTLRGLGLEVRLLGQLRSPDLAAVPQAAPPHPEEANRDIAPPPPSEPPPPAEPAHQEEAERVAGDEEVGTSPYSDLAKAWWSGQFDVTRLFPSPPSASSDQPSKPEQEEGKPQPHQEVERPQGKGEVPACPLCGSPMVLRTAKQGKRAGQQFWSCSRFPECRGTRPYRAETPKKA